MQLTFAHTFATYICSPSNPSKAKVANVCPYRSCVKWDTSSQHTSKLPHLPIPSYLLPPPLPTHPSSCLFLFSPLPASPSPRSPSTSSLFLLSASLSPLAASSLPARQDNAAPGHCAAAPGHCAASRAARVWGCEGVGGGTQGVRVLGGVTSPKSRINFRRARGQPSRRSTRVGNRGATTVCPRERSS